MNEFIRIIMYREAFMGTIKPLSVNLSGNQLSSKHQCVTGLKRPFLAQQNPIWRVCRRSLLPKNGRKLIFSAIRLWLISNDYVENARSFESIFLDSRKNEKKNEIFRANCS